MSLFRALLLLSSLCMPSLQQSLGHVLSSHANLSSFNDILTTQYPGLLSMLEATTQAQPITLLAPNNLAFSNIPYYPVIGPAWANDDTAAIRDILKYHVVTVDITSATLEPTFQYFPTWLNDSLFANVTNGQRVGGVLQQGATKEMIFLSGQSTRSLVVTEDIPFNGGHLQIVDAILIPPESFPETAEKFETAAEPYQLTSFLGATYSGKNNTLGFALNTTSDITMFVPNNIGMEQVSSALLAMSEGDLDSLLSYHIVVGNGGPFYSTSLRNATTLPTLQGGQLTVSFVDNSLFVNSARILTSDLLIAGGVMHVIDNVLDPSSAAASPVPSLATQAPVLPTGASNFQKSGAPFTTWLPDLTQNAIAGSAATSTAGSGCYGCGGDGDGGGGAAASTSLYVQPSNTPVPTGEAGRIFDVRLTVLALGGLTLVMCAM